MQLTITNKKGVTISDGMIGLFFEDINYAADGGIYAEMIENRNFEFQRATGDWDHYTQEYNCGYGWYSEAIMEYQTETPLNQENPHYLRFTTTKLCHSFSNKAYDGILLKKHHNYKVSLYAKSETYKGNITVAVDKDGERISSILLTETVDSEWKKYEGILVANEDIRYGTFFVLLEDEGTIDFDMISMIPEDAIFGMFRRDLTELLKDMKPGFLRFPGGCVVEGNEIENRYQWKKSIGKIEQRKANWNRWAVHENKKENQYCGPYAHYNQSLGLGYYEYFLLCEYIGAKALPIVNVGLACQYQSTQKVAMNSKEFEEYIQDALDLIEFANGDNNTTWGSVRCEMGHTAPFYLEYLGIGNEQWQTEEVDYFERYERFEKEIHKRYPDIKLIGSAGPDVFSEHYTKAWEWYRLEHKNNKNLAYAVDEHYYMEPSWFLEHNDFYDSYPRDVKVLAGEYAARVSNGMNNPKANTWETALAEAAFMTGLERNADIVVMACYAPLFARINYTQWSPDLIWFDDKTAYGTPSYYVQKMYSHAMGTYTIQSFFEKEKESKCYHTISYQEEKEELIIKLVNASSKEEKIEFRIEENWKIEEEGNLVYLQADDINLFHSIETPTLLVPEETALHLSELAKNKKQEIKIKPYSFYILKVKAKRE